ncbi:unnamed protein product [Clavelina lepadiformis]|uniref:Uncharacterized protein n=1 Tax=Clavelina lepadiformis TaxID=159417 RepID=A0ABP0GG62_CLALP
MKGTRKELRIGAIPTLKLPKKSVEVKKIPERRQPKERILLSKVYSTGLMDIRQQVKNYLRKPWLCNDKGNYVEFELKEHYDQVKYLVAVNENLDVVVIYYGWIVTFTERKFDLKSMTVCQMLSTVENLVICSGCDKSNQDNSIVPHVITKSASPFSVDNCRLPTVKNIAFRSLKCLIAVFDMKAEEKAVCTECRCSVLAYAEKFSKRANYKEAVQGLPLKRICVERSVPSRLAATIHMKDKKIEELRNQVKKLLTSEDHISVDALMAQDLNYLMKSEIWFVGNPIAESRSILMGGKIYEWGSQAILVQK